MHGRYIAGITLEYPWHIPRISKPSIGYTQVYFALYDVTKSDLLLQTCQKDTRFITSIIPIGRDEFLLSYNFFIFFFLVFFLFFQFKITCKDILKFSNISYGHV
uniref:Uncharacterized protein n=1 Tax=Cacopsylla melanoneura TaxID=428564 RepID=A0A8D9BR43_9HEMI